MNCAYLRICSPAAIARVAILWPRGDQPFGFGVFNWYARLQRVCRRDDIVFWV